MIPAEWLHERLDETDPEKEARRELQRLEVDGLEAEQVLASAAFARWRHKWADFLGLMAPGDELWFFTSPPELWQSLAGVAGYAIVRDGKPIHVLTSRRS
ncbi:hypothetical protein [Polyangium sp. y55x31]|uniref:hypothetical protein n=1 Tax=Polyangium sp. y55x31 TaxID=3042688 RepID=UPI0024826F12|nr:hypothetical protein [Polyangium sp. y55x31]MDI1476866.1 hypothetical protein [Polyangium sp. y55x31]